MKCHNCKRVFNVGSEWDRKISTYLWNGEEIVVGFDREYRVPPGAPGDARLLRIEHYKCYLARTKRESRSDSSRTSLVPTWDQVDQEVPGSRELQEKMKAIRERELDAGYGKANWSDLERAKAEERGGLYSHDHPEFMAHYQLAAHLLYAHGIPPNLDMAVQRQQHDEDHAKTSLFRTQESRAADPGYVDPGLGDSDWRDQDVREIRDIVAGQQDSEDS